MKTTEWSLFSLAFFLPYDDCNPNEVDKIKTIIIAKSLYHA